MLRQIKHSLLRLAAAPWYRHKLSKAQTLLKQNQQNQIPTFHATEILPGKLYLGNLQDAIDSQSLRDRNIKFLVTAIHGMPQLLSAESVSNHFNEEDESRDPLEKNGMRRNQSDQHWWVRVPVLDKEEATIASYFDTMNQWIDNRMSPVEDDATERHSYEQEHQKLLEGGIDSFPFFPSTLGTSNKNASTALDEETETVAVTESLSENLSSPGAVLVHCIEGKSRSASLVIAYVMWKQHMPFEEALRFVKEKRPLADPNPTFQRELREYEDVLRQRGHYENSIASGSQKNREETV